MIAQINENSHNDSTHEIMVNYWFVYTPNVVLKALNSAKQVGIDVSCPSILWYKAFVCVMHTRTCHLCRHQGRIHTFSLAPPISFFVVATSHHRFHQDRAWHRPLSSQIVARVGPLSYFCIIWGWQQSWMGQFWCHWELWMCEHGSVCIWLLCLHEMCCKVWTNSVLEANVAFGVRFGL
jgi:hypothetical protein